MIYFAYGSNMHPERLRRRVPSRVRVATAELRGYRLTFGKRGADGSGKCALLPATLTEKVHGVLYRICPSHRAALDAAEGIHTGGYEPVDVEVWTGEKHLAAFTYVPPPRFVDPDLAPFDWYRAFVVEGARHHALPEHWIASLLRVGTRRDPDRARTRLNTRILERDVAADGSGSELQSAAGSESFSSE